MYVNVSGLSHLLSAVCERSKMLIIKKRKVKTKAIHFIFLIVVVWPSKRISSSLQAFFSIHFIRLQFALMCCTTNGEIYPKTCRDVSPLQQQSITHRGLSLMFPTAGFQKSTCYFGSFSSSNAFNLNYQTKAKGAKVTCSQLGLAELHVAEL